ncbi:MAG TPA: ABC transporter permease [Polyangia bacterium]|nr:ABC transporter permease [Polyangia bacterium]
MKWRAIFRNELLTVLRSPWYWVSALVSPMLALLLILGAPRLLDRYGNAPWRVGTWVPATAAAADALPDIQRRVPRAVWVPLRRSPGPEERAQLRKGELDAILVLDGADLATTHAQLLTRSLGKPSRMRALQDALNEAIAQRRLAAAGLTRAQLDALQATVPLRVQQIDAEQARHSEDAIWIAYGLLGITFLMVLLFGATVVNAMCKEKSTKMVEVILSCATAEDLVLGKVAGICASAFMDVLLWVAVGGVELQVVRWLLGPAAPTPADPRAPSMADTGGGVLEQVLALPPSFWILCVAFLLLGLTLFILFYAAVGSLVETPQDGQHLMLPISVAWEIPVVLSFVVKEVPDAPFSVVASLIPPFAPFLMPMRMTLSSVPGWQVAASLVLLMASIWASHRITAKIYRMGLLIAGKPPTVSQIWRWFRAA